MLIKALRTHHAVGLLLILALAGPFVGHALAEDVIPIKAGSTTDGLDKALQQARELRARRAPKERGPIIIRFAPGDYVLDRTWTIKPEDAGTQDAPLIIEGAPQGQTSLLGAQPLTRVRTLEGVWQYTPPTALYRSRERSPGPLFIGETRAVLARQPNLGSYFNVARGGNVDKLKATEKDAAQIAQMTAENRARALLRVMHSWTHSEHRISSVNTERAELAITPPSKWPFLEFGPSQRYYLANLPDAFDAPGEWLPTGGALQVRPTPAMNREGEAAKAYWPHLSTLLALRGQGPGRTVQYVQIHGLRFAYTAEPPGVGGYIDNQAAVRVGATIEADFASDIGLINCVIEHTGNHGIWLRRGVSRALLEGNKLDDLGAGGVRVGTAETLAQDERSGNNVLRRNLITHNGADYPGAVGIWIGKSSDNTVSDNVIAHTSYTGISVGWQWDFNDSTAANNVISGNVLIDIGQGTLSDMGAIYTLGRAPGSKMVGNFIRGVMDYAAYGAGGWGIYNDQGSTDWEIRDNVVLEARSGAYHAHIARGNVVERNLFALGKMPEISWDDVASSGPWTLRNNGVANKRARAMDIRGNPAGLKSEGNVFSSTQGQALGVEAGARPADVRIRSKGLDPRAWHQTVAHADALLRDLSPTDLHTADVNLRMTAAAQTARAQEPATQSWNFAAEDEGTVPKGLRYRKGLPAALLSIGHMQGDDPNSTCLKFQQGPNEFARYEPHTYVPTNFDEGETHISFTVKTDDSGVLLHEVRDGRSPYRTGIVLKLSRDGILANGKKVGAFKTGTWTEIDITIHRPTANAGNWDLSVRQAGGKPQTWKNLPLKQPDMESINWIGFISDTSTDGTTCLGRLGITHRDAQAR